jgi:hypothetical protein
MTQRSGLRSMAATLVGYLIVIIVVLILFKFIVGTILWVLRAVLVVVVLGALLTIYLRLKSPD